MSFIVFEVSYVSHGKDSNNYLKIMGTGISMQTGYGQTYSYVILSAIFICNENYLPFQNTCNALC